MADFFERVDWETSRRLEALARLSLELRGARDVVLRHYGIADTGELVARVRSGEVAEHPGWEHGLALRVLVDTREAVRAMIAAQGRGDTGALSLHQPLAAFAMEYAADLLAEPPRLTQDALSLLLKGGVTLVVHYASAEDYSLRWQARDADGGLREAGIDTAPLHHGLATQPNHLHTASGRVVADTITRPGAAPADNLRVLLDALRASPRFALED